MVLPPFHSHFTHLQRLLLGKEAFRALKQAPRPRAVQRSSAEGLPAPRRFLQLAGGQKGTAEQVVGVKAPAWQLNAQSRRSIFLGPQLNGQVSYQQALREERVGLLGNEALKEPQGFRTLVREAVEQSNALIADVARSQPSKAIVQQLDDISDAVCSVLDAAELLRNTHPDPEWQQEAHAAFLELNQYVQELNTSPVLYSALVRAMEKGAPQTGEEKRVANMLRMDFERGGIHLPEEQRLRVAHLNHEITGLGMTFGRNIVRDKSYVDVFPASKLWSLPESVRAMLQPIEMRKGLQHAAVRKGFRVGTEQLVVSSVLKWVQDAEVRKRVYTAGYSTPSNLPVLERLLQARHELAELLNYESFAAYQLRPLMSRTPEAVTTFLQDLSMQLRPKAKQELAILSDYKVQVTGGSEGRIQGWDQAYYTGLAKARAHNLDGSAVAAYFPLEQCLTGMGIIVDKLFGLKLLEVELDLGEAWASEVRKLAVVDSDQGELGYIYLDLYPRPSKYPSAAHFTVRCGRQLSPQEYQTPVVALVCNFPAPVAGSPSLLNHNEVETLFHEFGHALHSLLSRTEYQHLSGTRAALDFVETPSNLMEYFVWDHRVLRHFARHYQTGEPIPERMVASLRQSKSMFAAMDMQSQLLYALMDQAFSGPQPPGVGETTAVMAELQNEHTMIPYVEGTHWQTRFNHLVGYGAGYYSYLYAKCFSAQIWADHFAEDPLARGAGKQLHELLRHGGARDPALLLKGLLGEDQVKTTATGGVVPCTNRVLKDVLK